MGSHVAHVSLTPIPENKISATTLNPNSRFVLAFSCNHLCREADLEMLATIHLCMEWSLWLSVWLYSPVQGGGSRNASNYYWCVINLVSFSTMSTVLWTVCYGLAGLVLVLTCVLVVAWYIVIFMAAEVPGSNPWTSLPLHFYFILFIYSFLCYSFYTYFLYR